MAYTSEDVRHGSPMFNKCMRSGFNDVVVSSCLQPGRCPRFTRHAAAGCGTARHACCHCSGLKQLVQLACTRVLQRAPPCSAQPSLLQPSQVSTSHFQLTLAPPHCTAAQANEPTGCHTAAVTLAARRERPAGVQRRQQPQRRKQRRRGSVQLLAAWLQHVSGQHASWCCWQAECGRQPQHRVSCCA